MATETTVATHATADTGHAAADAGHGGAEAVGMPQLDFSTFPNQMFWLAVTLVVIYLILTRVALPRIASVLAERKGTITNDLAAAEDLKRQAEDAEAAYNKALADARAEAQKIILEAKADIRGELDAAVAKADAEIAARTAESAKVIAEVRASAVESVQAVASDVAQDIVAKLGSKPDAKALAAAVADHLKG